MPNPTPEPPDVAASTDPLDRIRQRIAECKARQWSVPGEVYWMMDCLTLLDALEAARAQLAETERVRRGNHETALAFRAQNRKAERERDAQRLRADRAEQALAVSRAALGRAETAEAALVVARSALAVLAQADALFVAGKVALGVRVFRDALAALVGPPP